MTRTIKSFLRWLGFHVHEWGEWESLGNIVRADDEGVIGECQRSECKTCKKARVHRVWVA